MKVKGHPQGECIAKRNENVFHTILTIIAVTEELVAVSSQTAALRLEDQR